jgi:hypothetical protein
MECDTIYCSSKCQIKVNILTLIQHNLTLNFLLNFLSFAGLGEASVSTPKSAFDAIQAAKIDNEIQRPKPTSLSD